jgi:hypothetical protein
MSHDPYGLGIVSLIKLASQLGISSGHFLKLDITLACILITTFSFSPTGNSFDYFDE